MNCTESPVFPFDNWVLGNSWKISIYTYIYIYLLLYVYYCCHEKENKGNPKWKQMPWMDMHASVHTSTCWRHWTIRGSSGTVFLNNKSNNLDTFVNWHFSYRENVLSMVERREYSERLNKIENIWERSEGWWSHVCHVWTCLCSIVYTQHHQNHLFVNCNPWQRFLKPHGQTPPK